MPDPFLDGLEDEDERILSRRAAEARARAEEYPEDRRGDCYEERAAAAVAPSANGRHEEDKPRPWPVLIPLASVQAEPVRWLWPGWLPAGAMSLLDGDPGLAKSTLTLDLAARVSRGWAMPPEGGGAAVRDPAGVVLLSAEDSLKNTVRPRLDLAGANVEMIHCLDAIRHGEEDRDPTLPYDLEFIADHIRQWRVRLIVVDPLAAHLGAEYDAHKDQDIRRCLRPLRGFAEKHDVSILLLRHLNKLNGGAALYRGGGSIGIIGAARAAWVVGRDPDDDKVHVLAMNKLNLGPLPTSLAYRLDPVRDVSRIAWLGSTDKVAHQVLWHHQTGSGRGPGRPADQLEAAKGLLHALVNGEPVAVKEIEEAAREQKIGWRTVKQAQKDLGIRAYKDSGAWFWASEEGSMQ